MDEKANDITPEERALYKRVAELHTRNQTLNHEEDERSMLEIVLAGAKKLPKLQLKQK